MGSISPTLPTLGANRGTEEADVLNALTAIVNEINGSLDDVNIADNSLTAASLATSAKPVTLLGQYRTVSEFFASYDAGGTLAGTSGVMFPGPSGDFTASGGAVTGDILRLVPILAADWSVAGLTPKLRVRAAMAVNATAPGRTFTYGLYPVTVAGGSNALTVTAGTVVSGSTVAIASPSASTVTAGVGSDFTLPSDGVYVLAVSTSGVVPAGAAAAVTCRLEVHHV